jgi:ABC-type nitrate/sulfonate/bicarbonate transport system substrate-binding protein
MGSDNSFLSLVAAPAISKIEDLKGKTVSVDAMTTGYAFVLYEILRRHGLNKDGLNKDGLDKEGGDYSIVRAGGMVQRWNALREGQHAATLLSAPYNIIAQNAGFRELVKATDVIGPYQGNVAAVRRPWARDNRAKVEAYIRAYRRSIAWLYEPANRVEAIAILRRHLPQMTQEMADASYGELLDPARGFFRNCEMDSAGFDCMLELRSRYGLPAKQLNESEKYCDLSFG